MRRDVQNLHFKIISATISKHKIHCSLYLYFHENTIEDNAWCVCDPYITLYCLMASSLRQNLCNKQLMPRYANTDTMESNQTASLSDQSIRITCLSAPNPDLSVPISFCKKMCRISEKTGAMHAAKFQRLYTKPLKHQWYMNICSTWISQKAQRQPEYNYLLLVYIS